MNGNNRRGKAMALVAALALALVVAGRATAEERSVPTRIALGTGEVQGYYYPVGGAVCRLINKDRPRHGLHCLVEPTGGTGANIAGLRSGQLDLAIIQSKAHSQAFEGSGPFESSGPFAKMRSLLTLHSEVLTVLVRKDGKVRSVMDLKRKRIALGSSGSFQREMADAVLQAHGWTTGDFETAQELDPAQQVEALCDGQVDAALVTVVHPSAVVGRAIDACGARVIDVGGPAMARYLSGRPYLVEMTVPAGVYPRLEGDRKSFGLTATLVATTDLPDEAAYEVVKMLLDNLTLLHGLYPVLAYLDKEGMARNGLSAPVHDGAARYFKEAGLSSDPGAARR